MKKIVRYFSLILILMAGSLPGLGAVDDIGFQWLFLGIANLIVLSANVFFYDKKGELHFKVLAKNKMILFFSVLIFFSLISITSSENISASVITLGQFFNLFISSLNILFILKLSNDIDTDFKLVSNVIILILIGELFLSYREILNDFVNFGWIVTGSKKYSGNTGNVNILSYAILIKIPFLFEKIINIQNKSKKTVIIFIYLLSISLVFILGSRSAFYMNSLIHFLLLAYLLKNKRFRLVFFAIITFSLSFLLNQNYSSKSFERFSNEIGSVVSNDDSSFQLRKRFINQSISMILENPLMGIGIGNWKLESIKTDSHNLKGYTVPYHSHNDFLEIGAETGIFGMIAFILLLIYPLIFFEKEINIKNLILLFSFIIYIFDSLINFPFARPANILIFLLILAFSYKKIERIKYA